MNKSDDMVDKMIDKLLNLKDKPYGKKPNLKE